MKILALTYLFILLFFRIKSTPSALSKTLWRNKTMKSIEKQKVANNNNPPSDTFQSGIILATFFIELFFVIFYIVLGSSIGTTEFIVLSALQVFSCFWGFFAEISEIKNIFSYDIDDHKFHRFRFLFNVILDYIYYPLAIYMLLK